MEATPDSFLDHLRMMRAHGFNQSMLLQLLGDPRGFEKKKKTDPKEKRSKDKPSVSNRDKEPEAIADGRKAQKNKSLLEWFKAIDEAVCKVAPTIGHMPGLDTATDFKLWRMTWDTRPVAEYRDKVKAAALEGGEVVHKEDPVTGVDTEETFTRTNLSEQGFLWKVAEASGLGPLSDKTTTWSREIKPLFPSLTPIKGKEKKEQEREPARASTTSASARPKAKSSSGKKAAQVSASEKQK